MQTGVRGFTLLMFISLLGLAGMAALFYTPETPVRSYTDLVQEVTAGAVRSVTISGTGATVQSSVGDRYRVNLPGHSMSLQALLVEKGVAVEYSRSGQQTTDSGLLFWLMPTLMIGSALWMMNSMGSERPDSSAFSETRARPIASTERRTTMSDVAGMPEAKEEVGEIVDFLRNPERYREMGARIPRGVLLAGPPGTGKTLLARAVAGEAGVDFFSLSGSEFVEMYAGVGAARVRDLFARARESTPCIIFVDELDAVGKRRGMSANSGTDERDQTLNQLLVELDGFDAAEGIIVMAATNRPDVLDPALLRPGRFDRQIAIDLPDCRGREEILAVHAHGKALAGGIDLSRVAALTPGFSGADLANLLNEAALMAARLRHKTIEMDDILSAYDRIRSGGPPLHRTLSGEERRRIAVHEAAHGLVASLLPHADPIEKLSLAMHGRGTGSVLYRIRTEKGLKSRSELLDRLAVLLAGRAAEEILIGEVATSAADDLEQVTDLARQMVTEMGMSPEIGPVAIGIQQSTVTGETMRRNTSDLMAGAVDHAVRSLVGEAYQIACSLVDQHSETVLKIADALMEQESLTASQINALMAESDVLKGDAANHESIGEGSPDCRPDSAGAD